MHALHTLTHTQTILLTKSVFSMEFVQWKLYITVFSSDCTKLSLDTSTQQDIKECNYFYVN